MDIHCGNCKAWIKEKYYIPKEKGSGWSPRICRECHQKMPEFMRKKYRLSKRRAIGISVGYPMMFGGMSQ
jgi:hypothetical protein